LKEQRLAYLVLAPMMLFVAAFTIYPLASAVTHSFTAWDGVRPARWIGLRNYARILSDPQFYGLLLNNVIIMASIPVQVFISLILTLLLFEKVPGWKFFRAVYFLPYVLSAVIIGYLFATAFAYQGPVNILLRAVGLGGLAVDWLSSGPTGMLVIVLSIIWASFGQGTVIFLAGMSTVDPAVLEAARIDGAGWWRRLFRVVLPMLGRAIEFFTVTSIIWSFTGTFAFVYSITSGGPGYETTPLDYMVYLKAFVNTGGNNMGSACALAMILFVIVLVISKAQLSLSRGIDEWSD
jgi:ABC-type sugar transport system permease subunit